ncbi:hypothetical protein [Salinispira pacifica]|uniref:Polymerase nucleotidyl transferase domain-containing protein n=1 Tax=Salinispira pacifica TaxID=1307761 RepID=V5WKR3_9SPIO|nr:hypothetical protein [Salinispira pacifica]AHC16235.1 hypothetical protein L21SP2_2887 [Salinispira pacifica]
MPQKTEVLKNRMEQLARSLQNNSDVLGLLGLGSVGGEIERLDDFSDLDFFLIVKEGKKADFLKDTRWLSLDGARVTWIFQNTPDGFKLFYEDGVYAENAVFTSDELKEAEYAPGRWWFRREELDEALKNPSARVRDPSRNHADPNDADPHDATRSTADPEEGAEKRGGSPGVQVPSRDSSWLLGEILSCIYVGMCRFQRGEKLSAWRFISGHAYSMFLELLEMTASERGVEVSPEAAVRDPYSIERRIELRQPEIEDCSSSILLGYDSIPESAANFLDILEDQFTVPRVPADQIRGLSRLF